MIQTSDFIKKDIYRFRFFLAAYCFIFVANIIVRFIVQMRVDNYAQLYAIFMSRQPGFNFLYVVLALVMIPLIVQEDSVTDGSSLLSTKPVSGITILWAKMLIICVLFILGPIIQMMLFYGALGIDLAYIIQGLSYVFFIIAYIILWGILVAALTRNFSQFFLVMFCSFITVGAWNHYARWIIDKFTLFHPVYYLCQLDYARLRYLRVESIVLNLILVVCFLSLTVVLYKNRNKRRTVLALGFLLILISISVLIIKKAAIDSIYSTIHDVQTPYERALTIEISEIKAEVTKEVSVKGKPTQNMKVVGAVTFDQLKPNEFVVLKRVFYPRLTSQNTQDRVLTQSETGGSLTYHDKAFILPLQHALKETIILNPFKPVQSNYVLLNTDDLSEMDLKDADRITVRIEYDVYRFEHWANMPLKKDAYFKKDIDRIFIEDFKNDSSKFSLKLKEYRWMMSVNKNFYGNDKDMMMGTSYLSRYALVNDHLSESLLLSEDIDSTGNLNKYLESNFHDYGYLRQLNCTGVPNKEWLNNAQLVRIDAVKQGTYYQDVVIPGEALRRMTIKQ